MIREWLCDVAACLGCFAIGVYALRWPLLAVLCVVVGVARC